ERPARSPAGGDAPAQGGAPVPPPRRASRAACGRPGAPRAAGWPRGSAGTTPYDHHALHGGGCQATSACCYLYLGWESPQGATSACCYLYLGWESPQGATSACCYLYLGWESPRGPRLPELR